MKKPQRVSPWQDNFKSSCLNVGFRLALSRAMCEFLSAVADDVHWDRSVYGSSQAFPDNFLATSRSLEKRGLVERKPEEVLEANKSRPASTSYELYSWTHYQLTPAGKAVVELLKMAGLFVEADMAIQKKHSKAS